MSESDQGASNVVPILTEVVPGMAGQAVDPGAAAHSVAQAAEQAARQAGFLMDEEALVDQVMERLDPQIDRMFEYRVREAIQPLLAALAEDLVLRLRDEIAGTVRDVVKRSLHQEVLKRGRRDS